MHNPGDVFRVDWPEYHVECAECSQIALISLAGHCNTKREAEREIIKTGGEEADGWKRIKGKWTCPRCWNS